MFEAQPPPPLWKPTRPIIVDCVIQYDAFDLMADCVLLHCQTEEAKAWCHANIANLANLIWGEAICLKITELPQITSYMRDAGLKISELGH